MENNKNICPNCGVEMIESYEKPALNLVCPKCGCKIATTKWEEIDLDDTKYSIVIEPMDSPKMDQIKMISSNSSMNYIVSKELLKNGGVFYEGDAISVLDMKKKFEVNSISFHITPEFKY